MCSNPLCRSLTVKADFTDITQVRSGKSCHIHSVGPGGPRYKSGMSDRECASFENGIWLCDKCAREIDDNKSQYSAETLRIWKKEAEDYVSELVTQDSRLRQLQTMMQTVLTDLRLLTALIGSVGDITFNPPGRVNVTRMLIEADQLLFERRFKKEADTIRQIGAELEAIYGEMSALGTNQVLDISAWKHSAVRSLMIDVLRFSEDSYERYKIKESSMVSDVSRMLIDKGFTLIQCKTMHEFHAL
jgi:hypothetical protein